METEPTRVRWPGGAVTSDPWDDRCWPSLDTDGAFRGLWSAWREWRTGQLPLEGFEQVAHDLGLTEPLAPDRNHLRRGVPLASLEQLARIALDHWPAAGGDGPDMVLGPASVFAPDALRLVAVAGCAFLRTEDMPYNAVHVWFRGKPPPTAAERASVHAVELAPWALWEVVERWPDGRVTLRDATGLGPQYLPIGPVQILGGLPVERAMAARVLPGPDDHWVAHTVVPLDVLPSRADVERWITHEAWLARTFQPGITREALLRKRPVLVRRAIEHAVYGQSPPTAVTVRR
ncbi:MAG: hypothetical protein R3F61_27330 [Myxococcota bacterium]